MDIDYYTESLYDAIGTRANANLYTSYVTRQYMTWNKEWNERDDATYSLQNTTHNGIDLTKHNTYPSHFSKNKEN